VVPVFSIAFLALTGSTCVFLLFLLALLLHARAQWECSSWRPFSSLSHRVALVGGWLAGLLLSRLRVLQIMETCVKRKFGNQVLVYLQSTADGVDEVRMDTI